MGTLIEFLIFKILSIKNLLAILTVNCSLGLKPQELSALCSVICQIHVSTCLAELSTVITINLKLVKGTYHNKPLIITLLKNSE